MRNKRRNISILVFILLGVSALFTGKTLAAYIERAVLQQRLAAASKPFHFTSNFLTDGEMIPVYEITHDWNGDALISFDLKNYKDALNISKDDISYNVSYKIQGVTKAAGSGLIEGSESEIVPVHIEVELSETREPVEVEVTATAMAPYSKSIRAKFLITPAISYTMEDNTGLPVAILRVSLAQSTELTKDVVIEWSQGAWPDMTNAMILDGTIDLGNRELSVSLNTAGTYELVFFKSQSAVNYGGVTVVGE